MGSMINVGKYTSQIDPMGIRAVQLPGGCSELKIKPRSYDPSTWPKIHG